MPRSAVTPGRTASAARPRPAIRTLIPLYAYWYWPRTLPPARTIRALSLSWVILRDRAVAIWLALLALPLVAGAPLSWTITVTGLLLRIDGPNWGSILLTSSRV